MELEEMKSVWSTMSVELDKQKKLTSDLILKMAHEKSNSRLGRIIFAESVGSVVALAAAIYVLTNFDRFNSTFNVIAGAGTVALLIISVIMAIFLIRKARMINILNDTYTEAITHYRELKKMLRFYKRFSMVMYFIMPFILLPVVSLLVIGKDLSTDTGELLEVLLACVIVLPISWFLVMWFYKSNLRKVSSAFKDVEKIENKD